MRRPFGWTPLATVDPLPGGLGHLSPSLTGDYLPDAEYAAATFNLTPRPETT